MRKLLPILLTLAVLLLLVAAWGDRGRIAALRAEYAALLARAESQDLMADPAAEGGMALPAKLPREGKEDRTAKAKRVAVDFISYLSDMQALGEKARKYPSEELRARMLEQLGAVARLDAGETQIAIVEVAAQQDLPPELRATLLFHLMNRFIEKDPQQALLFLHERQDLQGYVGEKASWRREEAMQAAIEGWAGQQPEKALAWLREHQKTLAGPFIQEDINLWRGLIKGLIPKEGHLALKLEEEYLAIPGMPPPLESATVLLYRHASGSPEQATAAVGQVRDWAAAASSPEEAQNRKMAKLQFFGSLAASLGWRGFDESQRWIEAQDFNPEELAQIARSCVLVSFAACPQDRGRWAEWIASAVPLEQAREDLRYLVNEWHLSDPLGAEAWIETLGEGSAREAAAGVLAGRLVYTDPQAALRLALLIPEGKDRTKTLKLLYERWPREDDQARRAAEEMADTYGVER